MVKVYIQTKNQTSAELIANIDDEETFDAVAPLFYRYARELDMELSININEQALI